MTLEDVEYELRQIPGKHAGVWYLDESTGQRKPIQSVDVGAHGDIELTTVKNQVSITRPACVLCRVDESGMPNFGTILRDQLFGTEEEASSYLESNAVAPSLRDDYHPFMINLNYEVK